MVLSQYTHISYTHLFSSLFVLVANKSLKFCMEVFHKHTHNFYVILLCVLSLANMKAV